MTGLIFNVQRWSLHDGSGIRTLVFMKGCPLRCQWCDNPEGQANYPELAFLSVKCVGEKTCNACCMEACTIGAIVLSKEGKPIINRKNCTKCGECTKACYYEALKLVGSYMTVEEVIAEVEKDRAFYRNSGGGVTVGGGEVLMQSAFVTEFLKRCQQRYLHTAIETSGYGPWQRLKTMLKYVDLVYIDLKILDSVRHRELIGVPNELILNNAKKVLSIDRNYDVIIRVPIVPTCNDSEQNLSAIASFARVLGCEKIELLPYHRLGVPKYKQYGKENVLKNVEPPTSEQMEKLRLLVKSFGLQEMTGVL